MSKKLRSTKTPLPEMFERRPTSVRFSPSELDLVKQKARKANAKLSEFIRYAALFFEPKAGDFK